MSLVGPRGLIPASVATLFVVELATADSVTGPGDTVTLLGQCDSVREGMTFVNPDG